MSNLIQQLKSRGVTSERREIDVSEIFGPGDSAPKVYARQLTLADREWMMAVMRSVGQGEGVTLLPSMKARCRQIVRSLVDHKGERIMSDLDVNVLMSECRSDDIDLIGKRIDAAFPAGPSIEDAAKN